MGLPLASNVNSYYMLEVHFDNPSMKKSVDSSGFRLRYTSKLRENEGGMFIAGVALSSLHFIPPMQNEYKSAGYCSMGCTKEVNKQRQRVLKCYRATAHPKILFQN